MGEGDGAGKVAPAVPFGSAALGSGGYQPDFHHRFPSSRAGAVCQGIGEGESGGTGGGGGSGVGVGLGCRVRERPIDFNLLPGSLINNELFAGSKSKKIFI